ncbi:hypothetical protein [Bradyrhizobium diazoefficiens]
MTISNPAASGGVHVLLVQYQWRRIYAQMGNVCA